MAEVDYYIIGAGPAGVAVAHYLASKGYNVEIFEARPRVGEKPCGGGVPTEIHKFLPVPEDSVLNEIKVMEMYLNDKLLGRWEAGKTIFLLVDRTKYLESYINIDGIKLHTSTPVKIHNTQFTVNGTSLDPKKVIIATGVTWRLKERDMVAQTIQYILEDVKVEDPETMKFLFYNGLVGYAWIFPLSEKSVKVGIGGLNVSVEKLEAMLQNILEKYSLKGKLIKREGAPIDMGGLKPEWGVVEEGGPYVVGEAIGAVMPITGEGIRPSVITAHTLATSLDMNHDYVKMLSKLNIYKASKMQRKLLERVAKNGASLPFKEGELSPKTIELIYKLGMGEIGFKELLSLASKMPWLLKDII